MTIRGPLSDSSEGDRGSACLAGAASAELRHWTCESSPASRTKVESSIGFPRPQSQRDGVGAGSLPLSNGGELRLGYQRLQAGCLRYVGPSQCMLKISRHSSADRPTRNVELGTLEPILQEMPVPVDEPIAAENPEQRAKRKVRPKRYFRGSVAPPEQCQPEPEASPDE